jgi:kynurenine formamidase
MPLRRRRAVWLVLLGVLSGAACSAGPAAPPAFPAGQLIDLSHAYDTTTVFWPTADPFVLEAVADGVTDQGFYYAANKFRTSEHGGTHLDAPVHFARGKHAVDQIPLAQLIGPAVVVDVSAKCIADRDYQVRTDDFLAWERAEGVRIPSDAILLIRTGYSQYWPDAARYLGTAERGPGAVPKLHFPGIHPDAAKWLASERPVKAVGIDTASIDYGQSTRFETHQILYAIDVPGLENLTNLDRLPARGAHLVALPMKIRGGSGAPLRAIAIVADTQMR